MPRGKRIIAKRSVAPDPLYHHRLVSRYIHRIMKSGKKTVAQRIFYGALKTVEGKTKKNPIDTLEAATQNVAPSMEVRPRRVGGASYQVPMEVRGDRREALAVRWIIRAAHARPNKEYTTMEEKLAAELLDAAKGEGAAVKKRQDTHRMSEANKAFSHFRW